MHLVRCKIFFHPHWLATTSPCHPTPLGSAMLSPASDLAAFLLSSVASAIPHPANHPCHPAPCQTSPPVATTPIPPRSSAKSAFIRNAQRLGSALYHQPLASERSTTAFQHPRHAAIPHPSSKHSRGARLVENAKKRTQPHWPCRRHEKLVRGLWGISAKNGTSRFHLIWGRTITTRQHNLSACFRQGRQGLDNLLPLQEPVFQAKSGLRTKAKQPQLASLVQLLLQSFH